MSNVLKFPKKKKEVFRECPKCHGKMQAGRSVEGGKTVSGMLCVPCLVWIREENYSNVWD